MNKKVYYSWEDVEHMISSINNEMAADGWRPDYIVGMSRGGLVPAVMLSNMSGIPMHALGKDETNCWMSEEAFGYVSTYNDDTTVDDIVPDIPENANDHRKKILIMDDINDAGKTFEWLKADWIASCLPMDHRWDDVWNENVRFASLVDNESSVFVDVDYAGVEINKAENPLWCVFPWEAERDYGNK
jgi:hypoxanthine phosphoribosyltransferase